MNLENRIKSLIPPDLTNIIKNKAELNKRKKGTNGNWYCPQYTICSSSDFTNIYNYFRIGEFLIQLRETDRFLEETCIFKAGKYSTVEQKFYDTCGRNNHLEKNMVSSIFYVFPWEL